MNAVEFPQQTTILAKDQPQYNPLPVHIGSEEDGTPMTCCFLLSAEEIEEIKKTGVIWMRQLTFGKHFQPVNILAQNPFK